MEIQDTISRAGLTVLHKGKGKSNKTEINLRKTNKQKNQQRFESGRYKIIAGDSPMTDDHVIVLVWFEYRWPSLDQIYQDLREKKAVEVK